MRTASISRQYESPENSKYRVIQSTKDASCTLRATDLGGCTTEKLKLMKGNDYVQDTLRNELDDLLTEL